MESSPWGVDWNPKFEDDHRMKRSVMEGLTDDNVLKTIRRLSEQSVAESVEDGVETEHLIWLRTEGTFALFVRIWFEATEEKLFVIIEENDIGDVGFLQLEGYNCATYEGENILEVQFEEPETLGVEP